MVYYSAVCWVIRVIMVIRVITIYTILLVLYYQHNNYISAKR